MKRMKRRSALALLGVGAAFWMACRISRSFSGTMLNAVCLPAMGLLHRLTAPVPFPVAEPAALLLAALPPCAIVAGAAHAVCVRSLAPLRRALAGALAAALTPLCALLWLWEPVRQGMVFDAPPTPDAERLEWLCGELIADLNASELCFPEPAEILKRAPEVAGLSARAVKAVRYPEWMRAMGISGLFVPVTGEALVDGGAPAALLPFTAVHELTHLSGVADEGAANIAAWEICVAAGGEFADSARLWALRYAAGTLMRDDEAAWRRVYAKMEGALARTFRICGGEAPPSGQSAPGIHPFSLSQGDYAALAGYLAGRPQS